LALEDLLLVLATLFGVSLLSNATPFFGASYTLIATAELISAGFTLANFGLIVLVTALGATLAKIVIYSGAFGFRRELTKNRNIRLFDEWLNKRSFLIALFVSAFIPVLPLDDYIYIGAGANKAGLAPMLGVTLLAKLAKSAFEIFVEFNGILGISVLTKSVFGVTSVEFSIILSVFFIALGVALYKLDWEPLLKRALSHLSR
jgi:hypothetical protein